MKGQLPRMQVSGHLIAFLVFAAAYFMSALLRAVTATLAPVFSADFGLGSGELGLLGAAYFLGFAALQLPLGAALDRFGPRRTEAALVAVAALGCGLFAMAGTFWGLVAARAVIGAGVSACLMAPLTHFRRHLPARLQLRFNSWMLMTGSFGMLASTTPVQWLLPALGWRGIFAVLAVALGASVLALWFVLPSGAVVTPAPAVSGDEEAASGYRDVVRHPVFVRLAPMGFVIYGGLIAVQTLWAGPWLTRVCGWTSAQAGQGLMMINLAMLVAFFGWGWATPALHRAGISTDRVLIVGTPVGLVVLAGICMAGGQAAAGAWAGWCVATSVLSISQPALAQAFPARIAGRALSAFNLAIFAGVFAMQWGIGVAVDTLHGLGWQVEDAFRGAFGGVALLGMVSYGWYLWCWHRRGDNGPTPAAQP